MARQQSTSYSPKPTAKAPSSSPSFNAKPKAPARPHLTPAHEPTRCDWALKGNELMRAYHDGEWGVPVYDDRQQFEHLALETAQAGLSWAVVLNKREAYREAFAEFDPARIVRFTPARVEKLLQNPGIIRNRAKIQAVISNARAYLKLQDEIGSFSKFLWKFVDGKPIQNAWRHQKELPARTSISDLLSNELKRRGFKFVGSVVCYAHLQAVGLINDHLVSCFRYAPCSTLGRKRFPQRQR